MNLKEFNQVSECCGTKMNLTVETDDKGNLFLDHSELCSSCLNTATFQDANLYEALEKLTIEMLNELEYGEEIELNKEYTLYHYIEDDIVVVNEIDDWTEIVQVLWNEREITFESL